MQPRPFKDRVLVRQEPTKEKLDSGLYLPESADHALYNNFATVLAVGSTVNADDVKVGDRILFKRAPGTALVPDARDAALYADSAEWVDLLMLRIEDIIGVVEPEGEQA